MNEVMQEELQELDFEYVRKLGIVPVLWDGFNYEQVKQQHPNMMLSCAPLNNMSYMVN